MSWCTSGVKLQVLPFIDDRYLGSMLRFQRFSCFVGNNAIHVLYEFPIKFITPLVLEYTALDQIMQGKM